MLALAFGGLLVPAHLQSPGARDDGAAVAVLMSLAEKLASSQPHQPQLERTAVRLVFFGGEEVNMQGSAAYAAAGAVAMGGFAEGPVINCELVGGAAPFCYWESSGTFLSSLLRFGAGSAALPGGPLHPGAFTCGQRRIHL